MKEFKYMEDTVNKICESLINEPHLWVFETNKFTKENSGVWFWSSLVNSESITQTWDGASVSTVFSYEQGERIKEAYDIARQKQASVKQQKIIEAMMNKEKESEQTTKRWWEVWK